jgi:hypothetical protein
MLTSDAFITRVQTPRDAALSSPATTQVRCGGGGRGRGRGDFEDTVGVDGRAVQPAYPPAYGGHGQLS